MAADMPVLIVDFDDDKIKKLDDIAEKLKSAFSIGPGGLPLSSGAPASPPANSGNGGGSGSAENAFEKFIKALNKDAQETIKTFGQINKVINATGGMLKGLFESTIRWGGRMAALGNGSAFGFDSLSKNVAARARDSQALGMTTGQMQAAQNIYGTRISNIGGVMDVLAKAQQNPSEPAYAALVNQGIDPTASVAENLPKVISAIARITAQYRDSGTAQEKLNAMNLGGISDAGTTNQIMANRGDLTLLNQQFSSMSRTLDSAMGNGTERRYQQTATTLQNNWDRIGNSFIAAIARLNGPITTISNNIAASIEKFLEGSNGESLFDTLAQGLETFGKWLGSDDFQSDLKNFADCVTIIVKAIGEAISWVAGNVSGVNLSGSGTGKDTADPALVKFGDKYLNGRMPGANPLTNKYTGIFTEDGVHQNYQMPDALKANIKNFVTAANKSAGLPSGLMTAIAEQESSWNPLARNKVSGAAGLFQFMRGTAKAYGLNGDDVYDPNKATVAAARYLHDLDKRYDGDVAKMLTSYNGGRIDKNGNLSLKLETVDYLREILPQVQGAEQQHPGIMRQLDAAQDILAKSGKDARQIIELQIIQTPGSDVSAAVRGQYVPR